MAKRRYSLKSAASLGKELNRRLKIAQQLQRDLEKGGKAQPPLPMKFEGTALQQSRRLVSNLTKALQAVADTCGDNQLNTDYTIVDPEG